jgi:hypothetical protein
MTMKKWYIPVIVGAAVTYFVWTWNHAASLVAIAVTAATAWYFYSIEGK